MALYDAICAHVESEREAFDALDATAQGGAVVAMRILVFTARRLQSALTWVDAIATPALDLGTRYFIELAARRLIRGSVDLVLVPASDGGYATLSNPFSREIEGWSEPPGDEQVAIVFLPRREQRSGLLHPLIVHEIGHQACRSAGLTRQALELASERKRLAVRFAKASAELQAAGKVKQEADTILAEGLKAWSEEALCDAIACHYLGPTYLFAFVVEVLAGQIEPVGLSHPPPRRRISLMLATLEALGWGEVLSRFAAGLVEELETIGEEEPSYEGEYEFLVWAIETTSRDLRKLVARQLGDHTLVPDADLLAEIGDLLAVGIPPAQSHAREAIDPRTVSLGCWLFAIARSCGGISRLPAAADDSAVGRILAKGLEMAALARAWS